MDIAKLLLEYGANVNGKEGKVTPLHLAVQRQHRRMTAFLLSKGATVETSFKEGWTALHLAAQIGDTDMAKLLLDSGAPIDARNSIGMTPLHSAAFSGHLHFTKYLLSRGATCSLPTQPMPPLQIDTVKMVIAAVQEVLQHCPPVPTS